MRCSICDAEETTFKFNNWHCGTCIQVIRDTIFAQQIADEDYEYSVDSDWDGGTDSSTAVVTLLGVERGV